ncbi:MAG: hypothetical protein ACQESR_17165 [Planctomycetota bacterium]
MRFSLRCTIQELAQLARRYQARYPGEDDELQVLKETVASRGYLTKEELRAVARWKSPRSAWRVDANSEEYVRELTRFALSAETQRARIEILTLLDGVQWPTASVVLHFFHPEPYPILDFRALWSVSVDEPNQYRFDFWWQYVQYCRNIAQQAQLTMRELDQGLWEYSSENQ